MDLSKLSLFFRNEDLEWRVGSSGWNSAGKPWARVLVYVTNRAIMQRLDEVVGPENWSNAFREWKGGQLCGIGIRIDRGDGIHEWVQKWDGANDTDFEPLKGGLSDAMKRAAVQWGIGRYLYDFGKTYAACSSTQQNDWNKVFDKQKKQAFWWKTPRLEEVAPWAIPPEHKPKPMTEDELLNQVAEIALAIDDATHYPAVRGAMVPVFESQDMSQSQKAELAAAALTKGHEVVTVEDMESLEGLAEWMHKNNLMAKQDADAYVAMARSRLEIVSS